MAQKGGELMKNSDRKCPRDASSPDPQSSPKRTRAPLVSYYLDFTDALNRLIKATTL